MKKIILLTLSLSLSVPCFGMGRASQPASRWISQYIRSAWNTAFPSKQVPINQPLQRELSKYEQQILVQALPEDLALRHASSKLVEEIKNQHKILANLEKRSSKKSWHQWLFGRPSRSDESRFDRFLDDFRLARAKDRSLNDEYFKVQVRRRLLKSSTDERVPGQTLIKGPSPEDIDYGKFMYEYGKKK